jgi:hypothetical protein
MSSPERNAISRLFISSTGVGFSILAPLALFGIQNVP